MKAEIKDGGSALPRRIMKPYPGGGGYETSEGGMSLRDYFAAKAMQALIGDSHYQGEGSYKGWAEFADELSDEAYAIADAMLREREK